MADIELVELTKHYKQGKNIVRALDGVIAEFFVDLVEHGAEGFAALGRFFAQLQLLGRVGGLERGQAVHDIEQFTASFVSCGLLDLFARSTDKIHAFAMRFGFMFTIPASQCI